MKTELHPARFDDKPIMPDRFGGAGNKPIISDKKSARYTDWPIMPGRFGGSGNPPKICIPRNLH